RHLQVAGKEVPKLHKGASTLYNIIKGWLKNCRKNPFVFLVLIIQFVIHTFDLLKKLLMLAHNENIRSTHTDLDFLIEEHIEDLVVVTYVSLENTGLSGFQAGSDGFQIPAQLPATEREATMFTTEGGGGGGGG
ncbi:hypothetical protein ACJX0J_012692, partial [Zea mays]